MSQTRVDVIRALNGRSAIYSFLGRAYEREIDPDTLASYLSYLGRFQVYSELDGLDDDIRQGFREIREYLEGVDRQRLDEASLELAVDYANLFLHVKYAREGRGIAHPSESAYLTGHLYGKPTVQVSTIYSEVGFVKSPDFREPEDHAALELYFMAHMSRRAAEELSRENAPKALRDLEVQLKFLRDHLSAWAIRLADDVVENAETKFYRGVGRLTRGLVSYDADALEELVRLVKSHKK